MWERLSSRDSSVIRGWKAAPTGIKLSILSWYKYSVRALAPQVLSGERRVHKNEKNLDSRL